MAIHPNEKIQVRTDNLLLVPGDGETAQEIFHALRYEKTVRLFGCVPTGAGRLPYRLTPAVTDAPIGSTQFEADMAELIARYRIDYIVPTTAEARDFFHNSGLDAHILDSGPQDIASSSTAPFFAAADCYSNKNADVVFAGYRVFNEESQHWQTKELNETLQSLIEETSRKNSLAGAWTLALNPDGRTLGINTGICADMALYRMLGINFMLLQLHEMRGNPIKTLALKVPASMKDRRVRLHLKYDSVFLDLDDTLIVHGILNDTAISFLHHCRAQEVPVYLITRHYRDPRQTLQELGFDIQLLSSLIWITDDTPKSYFMNRAPQPIFIDDAFSERNEVMAKTGIPCLAPDMIAGLMTKL